MAVSLCARRHRKSHRGATMIDLLQPVRVKVPNDDDSKRIMWCRERLKYFADMYDVQKDNEIEFEASGAVQELPTGGHPLRTRGGGVDVLSR
jgi:hypothetical protein